MPHITRAGSLLCTPDARSGEARRMRFVMNLGLTHAPTRGADLAGGHGIAQHGAHILRERQLIVGSPDIFATFVREEASQCAPFIAWGVLASTTSSG
jgi:hypothetical protein